MLNIEANELQQQKIRLPLRKRNRDYKIGRKMLRLDFCCNVQMARSEFGINEGMQPSDLVSGIHREAAAGGSMVGTS